ncbi:MAG: hypothetical protein DKINENOH_00998 [bacterium]|nr:hypothetical protein [bacterium]
MARKEKKEVKKPEQSSKKVPNSQKGSNQAWKLRIELVATITIILSTIIGIFVIFRPISKKSDAELEVVDFKVDSSSYYPKLSLKIRNSGEKTAFLKQFDFRIYDYSIEYDPTIYTALVEPIQYNIMLTKQHLESGKKTQKVSRKIEPDSLANFDFILGYNEVKSKAKARIGVEIEYNSSQKVTTTTAHMIIDNFVARYPSLILATSVDGLLDQLLNSDDYVTQKQSIDGLKMIGNKKAAQFIAHYLSSKNTEVRRTAADALVEMGTPDVVFPLANALADSDAKVRSNSINALKNIGEPAVSQIISLLDSDNLALREIAIVTLGEIGTPVACSAIINSLKDTSIVRILFDERISISAVAAKALGKIAEKSTAVHLLPLLNDTNVTVRREAAVALGNVGDEKCIDQLIKALKDPDEIVRKNCLGALSKLTSIDENWSEADWQNWWQNNNDEQKN